MGIAAELLSGGEQERDRNTADFGQFGECSKWGRFREAGECVPPSSIQRQLGGNSGIVFFDETARVDAASGAGRYGASLELGHSLEAICGGLSRL